MNGQHNAGIHGWSALPQPPRPPQIDKLGSGGIQLGRWKTLLTVGVAVGLVSPPRAGADPTAIQRNQAKTP